MKSNSQPENESLVEGRDFYWEDGLMVLTEAYLRRRGYCCESGCRHCPYTEEGPPQERDSAPSA